MVLLTEESSNMVSDGTKPDVKKTSRPITVSGQGHIQDLGLCSPSREKKTRNMMREPSMVINPYQGKESSSAAQPIRAVPYLSASQPDRTSATAHTVKIHCGGLER